MLAVRAHAAETIGDVIVAVGTTDAQSDLLLRCATALSGDALQDGDKIVRRHVVDALGKVAIWGARDGIPVAILCVSAMLDRAQHDPSREAREHLTKILDEVARSANCESRQSLIDRIAAM